MFTWMAQHVRQFSGKPCEVQCKQAQGLCMSTQIEGCTGVRILLIRD